jgi:hypothetical protein
MSNEVLAKVIGKQILAASSSLNSYTLAFSDGSGILLAASGSARDAQITLSALLSENLPSLAEAVCAVDWSWIVGSTISAAQYGSQRIQLKLDPAGPLNISLGIWQAKPFLTFMPYKSK